MNGIFLDTDVLLDFLLGRASFLEEITKILERSAVDNNYFLYPRHHSEHRLHHYKTGNQAKS